MSHDYDTGDFNFMKENLDLYLKELAKEYRKIVRENAPAELILIGGASVLLNYDFRDSTTDVDALIEADSAMKEAIHRVGDKYGLPEDWVNAEFQYTDSYSPKLVQFSVYYRTFSNVLTIRTVSEEYLIAMKLRSGRRYKHDLSDVLGILKEHQKNGNPITMEQIKKAVSDLYGSYDSLRKSSQIFLERAMQDGDYEKLYQETVVQEKKVQEMLSRFEKDYPGILNDRNVDDISEKFERRLANADTMEALRKIKENK